MAPIKVQVWIDPALPPALRSPVMELIEGSEDTYVLTDEVGIAEILVEPQAERPLTQWVYAVVAAFPTVADSVTIDDLHQHWIAESAEGGLLVAPETATLLEQGFGREAGADVIQVEADDLLEFAWSLPVNISVVPFEELEPRWKVLLLEGQSPVQKMFDPQTYPLLIPFGISGSQPLLDAFAERLEWPASNRNPDRMTVLVMTGVTALTRATAWQMERRGVLYPAEAIGDWLRNADITHISNEVSFSSECPYPDPVQEQLKFCSDPEYFPLLEAIGVDVVELTGNHNKDFGSEPFLETLELFRAQGWITFGGGEDLYHSLEPGIIEHNGNKLAFLGCNQPGPRYAWATDSAPGAAPCSETALLKKIYQLRDEGYLPIFTFQWAELASPSDSQRESFAAAAQAGAVVVSGSQAHQPQPMAFESDAFIHYGLGNLFFDQMQSLVLRQQFVDRHIFYDGRHISTELLTALLENYARPRPMSVDERADFLEDIFVQSEW